MTTSFPINNNNNITQDWNSLNQYYYNYLHEMEKKEKEDEEKRKKDFAKLMDKLGYKPIDKEFAKTLICDGAYLQCSKGMIVNQSNTGTTISYADSGRPALINQMPEKIPMIELKVYESVHLGSRDAVATKKDSMYFNFKPFRNLKCQVTGDKCLLDVEMEPQEWKDCSKTLINGQPALLKESKFECTIAKKYGELAEVTIVDNGQDDLLKNAGMDSINCIIKCNKF